MKNIIFLLVIIAVVLAAYYFMFARKTTVEQTNSGTVEMKNFKYGSAKITSWDKLSK